MATSYTVKFRKEYNLKDLHCFSKCSSFFDHVVNVKKGTLNQVLMHRTCGIINTNKVLELKWGVIVRAPGWMYIMMTMQFTFYKLSRL
jgi:hypothetical protein